MDFEFDKEIDVLLRQARKGEVVPAAANTPSAHLDTDEISAFAENALPEKAKRNYTIHLADCDSCRKSLSEFILQSPELEDETIRSPEKITIVSPTIPWYRRLFALPNLAYTFGALIVLFGGFIGFMVLQNSNNLQTAEVAKVNEKPQTTEPIPSESISNSVESSSLANTNMAANVDSGAIYSANSATNSASMNSNMSVAATPFAVQPMPKMAAPQSQNSTAVAKKDEEKFSVDGAENEPKNQDFANKVTAGRRNARIQEDPRAITSADQTAPAPPLAQSSKQVSELPINNRQATDLKLSAPAKKAELKKEKLSASENETSNVGGKTFNRRNSVWYDTNYNQQPTTNITRGTEKYKNLDKGLRTIIENLGGTVVIVWKDKAYRIQ